MIELGDEVKHTINGFKGIVTGKCEYLAKCKSFLVTPQKLDKDGGIKDGQWIDEDYLKVTKKHKINMWNIPEPEESEFTGGVRDDFPPTQ